MAGHYNKRTMNNIEIDYPAIKHVCRYHEWIELRK